MQGRAAPQLTGPLDVSFVPAVPSSYSEFGALVGGRPPADLPLIVSRIRGANAAALAADSRKGLQVRLSGVSSMCGTVRIAAPGRQPKWPAGARLIRGFELRLSYRQCHCPQHCAHTRCAVRALI